ncbi:MAG: HEAT repeat domain-containing protein [Bradymonadia bacterium]
MKALALAVVGVFVEGAMVFRAEGMPNLTAGGIAFVLGLHFAAAVLCGEALRARMHAHLPEGGLYGLGLGMALLMPIFGVLGVLSMVLVPPRHTTRRKALDTPERARARAQQRARDTRRAAKWFTADIEVIAEALDDADVQLRLGAVEALARRTDPEAVRLLQRARENASFEVRFRAVSALGTLGLRYSRRIAQARRALEERPADLDLRVALAKLYLEYHRLGVEDAQAGRTMLDAANALFQQVSEHQRLPVSELVDWARCMTELGRPAEAFELLSQRERAGDTAGELLATLAEICFHRGALDEVRRYSREALATGALKAATRDTLQHWAEERAA